MTTNQLISEPFPHIVWTTLFNEDQLRQARSEFDDIPDSHWLKYENNHERKWAITFDGAGPTCKTFSNFLQSEDFIRLLERTFDIKGLTYSDLGGGLHRILPGGMLDVHVDFNRHDDGRFRRINVLIYLNEDPDPTADLWLCKNWPQDEATVRVPAKMGHVVAFATSETSWHGHPTPLQGDQERRSLAAYYYTQDAPAGYTSPHTTIFKDT